MSARLHRIVLLLLLAPLAPAQGGTPGLEHGPPWLGRDLELAVVHAPASAFIRLLASDAAAMQPTPYGLLELDRSRLYVAAVGTTDANGKLELALPIPLDPAWAERELHLQALVADSAAPGGWILSDAAHLRCVGARVYAGFAGYEGDVYEPPGPGGLAIVSAVTRRVVATVDYGLPPPVGVRSASAQPVFAWDLARGAVVSPMGELLLFDPFFGGLITSQPLPDASRRLAITGGGTVVVALEPGVDSNGLPLQPALVRAIDVRDGSAIGSLQLTRAVSGTWLWSVERDEAFLIEIETPTGPYFVRRVGLHSLEDRGAVPLPISGRRAWPSMAMDGAELYLSSFDLNTCWPGPFESELTLVDYDAATPSAQVSPISTAASAITPVPELGVWFSFGSIACFGPGYDFEARRSGELSLLHSWWPPAGWSEIAPREIEWDGAKLWMPYPMDTDGAARLLWFTPATLTWSNLNLVPFPLQVEIVHDSLVFTGAVLTHGYPAPGPGTRVYFVDPTTSEVQHVTVGKRGESLLGVSLP